MNQTLEMKRNLLYSICVYIFFCTQFYEASILYTFLIDFDHVSPIMYKSEPT